jgi:hypothetical protein
MYPAAHVQVSIGEPPAVALGLQVPPFRQVLLYVHGAQVAQVEPIYPGAQVQVSMGEPPGVPFGTQVAPFRQVLFTEQGIHDEQFCPP